MLRKDDPAQQLVYYQVSSLGQPPDILRSHPSFCYYYQAGIGTYTGSVLKTPILEDASKVLDEMVAWNLPDHIKGLSFLPHVPHLTVADQ